MADENRTKFIAIFVLTALMLVTGIGILIWCAVQGFEDTTAIIIGCVFIIFAFVQLITAFFWWKVSQQAVQCKHTTQLDRLGKTHSAPLLEGKYCNMEQHACDVSPTLPLNSTFIVSGSIPFIDASVDPSLEDLR